MVLLQKTESHKAEFTKYRLQKAEKLKRRKLIESKKECNSFFFSNILSLRNQLIPLSGRKGSSLSYISSNCKKLPSESFGHLNFV